MQNFITIGSLRAQLWWVEKSLFSLESQPALNTAYTVKMKSFETPKVRRTQLHPFLVFRNSFPIEFRNSISEFRNSIIKSFESPKMDAAESSSLLVFRNSSDPEFRNTSFGKNHCFAYFFLRLHLAECNLCWQVSTLVRCNFYVGLHWY